MKYPEGWSKIRTRKFINFRGKKYIVNYGNSTRMKKTQFSSSYFLTFQSIEILLGMGGE